MPAATKYLILTFAYKTSKVIIIDTDLCRQWYYALLKTLYGKLMQ